MMGHRHEMGGKPGERSGEADGHTHLTAAAGILLSEKDKEGWTHHHSEWTPFPGDDVPDAPMSGGPESG